MTNDSEFDLEDAANNAASEADYCRECSRWNLAYDSYKAGFSKALDLVMEVIDANCILNRIIVVDADELKAIISKLRGESK
jgi:hypothetical protein